MTQITLNIEKPSLLQLIKKLIAAIDGISIANTRKKTMDETEKTEAENLIMLNKISGAWSDNGRTSDEDIALIQSRRI